LLKYSPFLATFHELLAKLHIPYVIKVLIIYAEACRQNAVRVLLGFYGSPNILAILRKLMCTKNKKTLFLPFFRVFLAKNP